MQKYTCRCTIKRYSKELFYCLLMEFFDFLGYIIRRNHFYPAAAGEQMGEEIGGGTEAELEIDVVVGLFQEALRGMEREVAEGEALVAVGPKDDAGEGDARVGHHAEVFGEETFCVEVGVDGEGGVGEGEGGDAVEAEHHQSFCGNFVDVFLARDRNRAIAPLALRNVVAEEVPAAAEELDAVGLERPLRVGVAAVTTVGDGDADAALHGLHNLSEEFALGGDILEEDAVVESTGFAHDIADGEGGEHPLLDGVDAEQRVVDDIVAVVGVAADGDAEDAAEWGALAEVGVLPAVAEVGERDAPSAADGVHQPDILLEK